MLEKITKAFPKRYLLLSTVLLSTLCAFGQNNDSLPQRDTLAIYKKIKKVAYKRKATRLLFHAFFVDPAPLKYEVKPLSDKQQEKDPNLQFKGKVIRKITIEVFDPFGYSVNDTTKRGINPLQELGNRYHITSRNRIIRNLLLFKAGDTLELIKISESERLVREAGYVNDARIYIENIGADISDSVDIKVIVQDKWSLIVVGTGGTTFLKATLRERNILGTGQRFEQRMIFNRNGTYQFAGEYTVANISTSFVSSTVLYTIANDVTQAGFSLERPFYSSLTNWAGGIAAYQNWTTYKFLDTLDQTERESDLNYYSTDLWVARSVNVNKLKNKDRRISNIILALRYAQVHYQQRPSFLLDTNKLNIHNSLYLSSIGFSLRKYYKDQYIFRFGANEDIPEGLILQFLQGILYKEQGGIEYYMGFEASNGKHIDKVGYFSAHAAYGTFFRTSQANNATVNLGLTYFTDLLRSKRWYYRQFIYLKYVNGINKPAYEKIILRPDELYGFSNGSLLGSSKMIVNLEGVTYAPYNILGFRFAPLALLGYGMLKTNDVKLFKGHVYQSYAIGLLIRNESLLNSSFQITIGAYPYLPDNNKQWFRLNPVTSFTFKFRSFSITKPSVIRYE